MIRTVPCSPSHGLRGNDDEYSGSNSSNHCINTAIKHIQTHAQMDVVNRGIKSLKPLFANSILGVSPSRKPQLSYNLGRTYDHICRWQYYGVGGKNDCPYRAYLRHSIKRVYRIDPLTVKSGRAGGREIRVARILYYQDQN
jgi:hypothetical protein